LTPALVLYIEFEDMTVKYELYCTVFIVSYLFVEQTHTYLSLVWHYRVYVEVTRTEHTNGLEYSVEYDQCPRYLLNDTVPQCSTRRCRASNMVIYSIMLIRVTFDNTE
jgi:hypothetical protein